MKSNFFATVRTMRRYSKPPRSSYKQVQRRIRDRKKTIEKDPERAERERLARVAAFLKSFPS